jgi:hypothetical protein
MSLLRVKQLTGPTVQTLGAVIAFDGTRTQWSSDLSGAILIPQGSTSERPNSVSAGLMRFNTDTACFEVYTGRVWQNLAYVSPPPNVTIISAQSEYFCNGLEEYIIVRQIEASATTITLPSLPSSGQILNIKDGSGTAESFNIVITLSEGLIDGTNYVVIDQPYQSLTLLFDGNLWNIV